MLKYILNMQMKKINSTDEMTDFGKKFGSFLKGGEVIELVGDVGAGKTTFTKGLARGLGVAEAVQSPSFTISRIYDGANFQLKHYDFYRLNEPGIIADEIADGLGDFDNITVVEWGESVKDILPENRIKIIFKPLNEKTREVEIYNFEGEI